MAMRLEVAVRTDRRPVLCTKQVLVPEAPLARAYRTSLSTTCTSCQPPCPMQHITSDDTPNPRTRHFQHEYPLTTAN